MALLPEHGETGKGMGDHGGRRGHKVGETGHGGGREAAEGCSADLRCRPWWHNTYSALHDPGSELRVSENKVTGKLVEKMSDTRDLIVEYFVQDSSEV